MGNLVWTVLGTGSGLAAQSAARSVIKKLWVLATGKQPPANPLRPHVALAEAVGWAVVSGALVGVVRMLATRQAAKFYEKSAGHLPKKMQDVSA